MVADVFTQPPAPHHKKASYGPVLAPLDLFDNPQKYDFC